MDMSRFAKGFERDDPLDYSARTIQGWKATTRSLMRPATRWSHYFSERLDDYLAEQPIDTENFSHNLQVYTGNSTRQMLQQGAESIRNIAFRYPSIVPYLNELNFHSMNQEMGQYWARLMEPEVFTAPDYIDLTVIQARLSVQALKLVAIRGDFLRQTHRTSPNPREEDLWLDASFVGQTTEHEALIAQLEMLKQQPADARESLVLLPAPIGYDKSPNVHTASDFILVDINEKQALGIQAKTVLRGKNKYDPRYVSLIDGIEDLGNYLEVKGPTGRIDKKAMPGLLAADFILNNEGLYQESRYARIDGLQDIYDQIQFAKEIAEELLPQDAPTERAATAAEKLWPRIAYALYENDLEKETEPEEFLSSEE